MNPKRKGDNAEREYEELMKSRGYHTYKSPNVKFYNVDIFNLFDILAMNEEEVVLIQVKCNRVKDLKKIQNFKVPKGVRKVLAIKYDYQGFREIDC